MSEEYKDTQINDEVKARHMADKMDPLMTVAANAALSGQVALSEKLFDKGEKLGHRTGEAFDAQNEQAEEDLKSRLGLASELLEGYLSNSNIEHQSLATGRPGPVGDKLKAKIYELTGITEEAREKAEPIENHTVQIDVNGRLVENTGTAYEMPSELGTVVELWQKDVKNEDYFSISIHRNESAENAAQTAEVAQG